MIKSETLTSDQSTEIVYVHSHKRYFINNLDTYHGAYFLKEISKVLEKNASTKETSRTILAEDDMMSVPPPPEQPYEIIGTVTNPKIKSIDNVTRIIPKSECIPQMLACGNVIIDVSCDRSELQIAMEYIKSTYQWRSPLKPDSHRLPFRNRSITKMRSGGEEIPILLVLKELLEKESTIQAKQSGDGDAKSELAIADSTKKRHLILISTIMTWASTKPLDPETPDIPFVETDFRKRKPHPNYKLHYDTENEVIGIARKYRAFIGAIVVASGLTYGGKEEVLYYWFQKAWEYEKVLPILGRGSNAVPIINIIDLAKIVYNLIVDFPKKLYILAVEQNIVKQREIVKAIGRSIGTGMFQHIPPEDAFLIPEIDQRMYDLITLNLTMEPTFIVETMGLQWTSELTFAENVPQLYKQFKKERALKPFKVLIYGPPIVGKSSLAMQICKNYGLVYISPDTVTQDIMEDLEWRVHHWEVGEMAAITMFLGEEDENPDDDEEDENDEGAQEAAKQTLALLQSGRPISDEELLGYLRQRMLSRDALNRGWVLDGFPTNLAQCATLFDKGEEQDSDADEEPDEEPYDEDLDLYSGVLKKLLPDIVVYLDASDDFVCEKAMRQRDGEGSDEETIMKRLSEFRVSDTRDNTPLNFFDELDIHPIIVNVKDHTDYGMVIPYSEVTLRMGRPCRYGKLNDLIEAAKKKEKEEAERKKTLEAAALKELEDRLREEREEKMEYWTELYTLLREEEEAALAAASEPMRNYLVHHIFPTLTPALLEVAKLRPDDPIDFLAEYLFKLNPTGKMLEPGFNLQAEKLLGKIKILDAALLDLDINIEPLIGPEDLIEDVKPPKKINPMSAL